MNSEPNLTIRQEPIITDNMAEFLTPGVIVEVDPDEAEALGAFQETALSEEDDWGK
jgi:molecular chaperone DnaK (HSP70)